MADGFNFVYDLTALDKCIHNMESVIQDTNLLTTDIVNIRREIDNRWDGAADRAYGERCMSVLDKISKLNGEMVKNRDKLISAVDKYRTNEQKQVQNVNNLSDDDIF